MAWEPEPKEDCQKLDEDDMDCLERGLPEDEWCEACREWEGWAKRQ